MFAVTRCTNGTFKVETEHGDEKSARVAFHNYCAALWNEKNVDVNAKVAILNEELAIVEEEKIVVTQPKTEPQGE